MWLAQRLSALRGWWGSLGNPRSYQAQALFSPGLPAEFLGSSQFGTSHSTVGSLFTQD